MPCMSTCISVGVSTDSFKTFSASGIACGTYYPRSVPGTCASTFAGIVVAWPCTISGDDVGASIGHELRMPANGLSPDDVTVDLGAGATNIDLCP